MYTSLNQIFTNSKLELYPVSLFTMCYSDGKLLSRNDFSVVDNILSVNKDSLDSVDLYYGYNNGLIYEYHTTLASEFTVIYGPDIFNNVINGLLGKTLMVFVNGEIVPQESYTVYNDSTLYLYITKPVTQINRVQILVTSFVRYGGIRTYEELTNYAKEYAGKKIKYDINKVLIYRNGSLIPQHEITNAGGYSQFFQVLSENDRIEFYEIQNDCHANHFTSTLGYIDYGPYDMYNIKVPLFYDTIIVLNDLANLVVDNLRQGYFINEVNANGRLMVIDEHFETPYLHCVTLTSFQTTSYDEDEYFFQVPDMKDIIDYLSPFDRQFSLLPEILTVFQKILLNEIYDEVLRIRDLRNLSRVDSDHIEHMLKFLGMNSNIHSLNLKQRRTLLEELNNFYNILGTLPSYNFFNICAGGNLLGNIEQLFTYHNCEDDYSTYHLLPENRTKREYVDFFTKEECGANLKTAYIKPAIDLGYVKLDADQAIDIGPDGYLSNDQETVGINYGYVKDIIKGKWIRWWEWDRYHDCYPTNHVHLEVNAVPGSDNAEIVRKFREHFYVLASTVLYIHDLTINYNFGGNDTTAIGGNNSGILGNTNGQKVIQYGILTAPYYMESSYSFTSDPTIQDPRLTIGLSNLEIIEAVELAYSQGRMTEEERAKFLEVDELGQITVKYNNLNKSCILTINVIPNDATITFSGNFYVQGNRVSVPVGTILTYTITKEGYNTIVDTIELHEDTVLDIVMTLENMEFEDLGYVKYNYEDEENLGLVTETAQVIEDLGEV